MAIVQISRRSVHNKAARRRFRIGYLGKTCRTRRACGLMTSKGKRAFYGGRRVYINRKGLRYVMVNNKPIGYRKYKNQR